MLDIKSIENLKATLKDEFYKVGAFRSYDKKRFYRQGVGIMKSCSIVESLISLDKSCDRSCGFGCSEIEITHKPDKSIEILFTYNPVISLCKTLRQKLVLIAY